MILTLSRAISRFRRDEAGVSAIEFALVAPVLIALYLGSVQLTLALTADRKVTAAASAIGDLIAQDDVVTDGELDDIIAAGHAILEPFTETGFDLRITSVRMNSNSEVYVDWSDARGLTPHPPGAQLDLPDGLLAPNNSVILVEVEYLYETPFRELEFGIMTLKDSVYLRPRRSLWVQRS